jgi:hypothetical protein
MAAAAAAAVLCILLQRTPSSQSVGSDNHCRLKYTTCPFCFGGEVYDLLQRTLKWTLIILHHTQNDREQLRIIGISHLKRVSSILTLLISVEILYNIVISAAFIEQM